MIEAQSKQINKKRKQYVTHGLPFMFMPDREMLGMALFVLSSSHVLPNKSTNKQT